MTGHIPVLFNECMEMLRPENGGIFVDATLGGAGHTKGLLERGPIKLIGVDKDADAIERCASELNAYSDRITLIHDDFKNIRSILASLNINGIDGALMDLGVSSFQLDTPERGFSYSCDAPLDMRMDKSSGLSAYTVVNEYDEAQIKKLLYEYGEERFAPSIAASIIRNRPVSTTAQLADIVRNAIPAAARRTGGNPAKRTFQAIRIEVNGEIKDLESTLNEFIEVLNPGGRLAVISFHSLEDRAVKQAFKRAENPCTCPPDFPICVCGKKPLGKTITRKPIVPDISETENNMRAHSAKLRIFERTDTAK